MEWRRACSTSVMQVEQPAQGIYLMPIKWYFAPTGAKTFRGVNAFVGGIWDRETPEQNYLLGEQQPFDSPFYNGKNVWGYIGQCRIGTDAQFAGGLSAADLEAPLLPIPTCCKPRVLNVGELDGGKVRQPPVTLVAGELDGVRDPQVDQAVAGGELAGVQDLQSGLKAIAGEDAGVQDLQLELHVAGGEIAGVQDLQAGLKAIAGEDAGVQDLQHDLAVAGGEIAGVQDLQSGLKAIAGEDAGGRVNQPGVTLVAGDAEGDANVQPASKPIAGELGGGRVNQPGVTLVAGELSGASLISDTSGVIAGEKGGGNAPSSSATVNAGELAGTGDVPGQVPFRVPLGSAVDLGPVISLTMHSCTVNAGGFLIVNVIWDSSVSSLSVTFNGGGMGGSFGTQALPGTTYLFQQFELFCGTTTTGDIVVTSGGSASFFMMNALWWANLQNGGFADQVTFSSGTTLAPNAGPSSNTSFDDEGVSAAAGVVYSSGSPTWINGFIAGGQDAHLSIGGIDLWLFESFQVFDSIQAFDAALVGLTTSSWFIYAISYH